MFDIRNFVIDRPVMGAMARYGRVAWVLSDMQDVSLNMATEKEDKTDALGNIITQFERAKTATLSGASGFFELDLLADQAGTTRVVASDTKKIVARFMGTVAVKDGETSVTLEETPVKDSLVEISVFEKGKTLGKAYTVGATADNDHFSISGKTLTLPTDIKCEEIFMIYDYETTSGIEIVNETGQYTQPGEFTLQVLGVDKCDPGKQILAYLIFGNAKLSGDVDINFNTDMTHGFEISANTDYCEGGRLWRLVIPGLKEDAAA